MSYVVITFCPWYCPWCALHIYAIYRGYKYNLCPPENIS